MRLKKQGNKYEATTQFMGKLYRLELTGDSLEEVKYHLSLREFDVLETGTPITLPTSVVSLLVNEDWKAA